MHAFARLYEAIDATTSTQAKVDAIAAYLRAADPEDAAWALFFLTGQRFKRLVPVRSLCDWAIEIAGIPGWLFDESYGSVGDLAELISLVIDGVDFAAPDEPEIGSRDPRAARDLFARPASIPASIPITLADHARAVIALRDLPEDVQRARVLAMWKRLDRTGVLLLGKMITGQINEFHA